MAETMIEVFGETKLLASLEEYRIKTTIEVKEAVRLSAEDALEVAVEVCPVSPDGSHGNPPGTLRDGNKIRRLSELGNIEQWELYNNVFYAGYVLFGTRNMAAQDFFTPAFDYGRQRLAERLAVIGETRGGFLQRIGKLFGRG